MCAFPVSETVLFSVLSHWRQAGSQTVFSLSSETKVCLFSRGKPLFCFFPFPSTLLPVKAVLAFPSTHILKWTVKTRCSETLQRNWDFFFCSSNVCSIWRYRAHVSDQIHFNQTLKPRRAIAQASLSLTSASVYVGMNVQLTSVDSFLIAYNSGGDVTLELSKHFTRSLFYF